MARGWPGFLRSRVSRWSRSIARTVRLDGVPGKSDRSTRSKRPGRRSAGRASGIAKTADGNVEAIRALLVAKRSARETRITTLNQIRHLGFTAPDELRERLHGVPPGSPGGHQPQRCAPAPARDPVLFATKTALRTLGRRVLALDDEADELDAQLGELVTRDRAAAARLSTVSGSTPPRSCSSPRATTRERLRTEAAFAHLCGVAPIEASSGKTIRVTDSTAAATAKPTMRCGASCSPA